MMGVFGILGLWKITFVTSSLCHSRSSVKSPVKVFEFRENFCFTFLYGPMNFRKILVQTAKWSISPKITDLQNSGKSSWRPFSYVGSIFKCLQLIYSWKGNFIRINKNQSPKMYVFQAIDKRRRNIFLKVVSFLLKIVKIRKNDLTRSQQLSN